MSAVTVPETVVLDDLDRQIIRALQLNPRAPFRLFAQVLGASEQTIARRYRRLLRQGVLHVIALVDPRALGESDWILRVRCKPNATFDVGRALSRRTDIAWASVSAGGTELICSVRSHTRTEREWLLLDRLPRTAAVLDITAAVTLRRFIGGGAADWLGIQDCLGADQRRALELPRPPRNPTAAAIDIGPEDLALFEVLRHDGRASTRELSEASGLSEGRITRRLATLFDSEVLYLDVDLASASLGFPASAYLWLTVAPAALEAACAQIATHDEVPFVAAITGRHNAVATIVTQTLEDVYVYLTQRIAAIDGIVSYEVSPVAQRLKQAGTLFDGNRLVVDGG